jgi:outer membrane immunogenic protein
MKIKLIGTGLAVAALAMTSLAQAADLPQRMDAPAQVYTKAPMAAYYSWAGFYAGLNIGYGFGTAREDITFPSIPPTTASTSESLKGIVGGGQLGFNMQNGAFVWGLETDIQYSGQKASTDTPCIATTCGVGNTFTETDKLTWFGTTRGRLGFAADRILIYGTGGVAYGAASAQGCVNNGIGCATLSSTTKFGWTAGAGVEGALADRWTWRVEFLYLDFGKSNNTTVIPLVGTVASSTRVTDSVIRTGLNFRF